MFLQIYKFCIHRKITFNLIKTNAQPLYSNPMCVGIKRKGINNFAKIAQL